MLSSWVDQQPVIESLTWTFSSAVGWLLVAAVRDSEEHWGTVISLGPLVREFDQSSSRSSACSWGLHCTFFLPNFPTMNDGACCSPGY